jgi:hypothetical protein
MKRSLKQDKIVEKRLKKSNKIEKLCSSPKPFKVKKVKSSTLFNYAPVSSFLELSKAEMITEFITKKKQLKAFKHFIRMKIRIGNEEEKELIHEIFQTDALAEYIKQQTLMKEKEELYRVEAMSLANIYLKYGFPVSICSNDSQNDFSILSNVLTRNIVCEKYKFELMPPISNDRDIFTFFYKLKQIYLSKNLAQVGFILHCKIPYQTIVNSVLLCLPFRK